MSGSCECGLAYAADHPPEVRYHRGVHDAWQQGVKLSPLQGDHVVSRRGEIEVLVVVPGAPRPQRRTPFEPEGQALARRLCPDVLYVAW